LARRKKSWQCIDVDAHVVADFGGLPEALGWLTQESQVVEQIGEPVAHSESFRLSARDKHKVVDVGLD
jgi:hypothetical protein